MKDLKVEKIKDITVFADVKSKSAFKMRLCAIRKSDKEAQEAMDKAKREQKKKQRNIHPETIELHRYIILEASLPIEADGASILELYRVKWRIQIAFKRLKSILGLGHLPKKDETSCRAWLHGKLFVALLAQTIIDEGRFFPWRYPVFYNPR